ncbi:hypothetical protein [Nonomuraea dietziae]
MITTTGFVYPRSYGPGVVERLEQACKKGGSAPSTAPASTPAS